MTNFFRPVQYLVASLKVSVYQTRPRFPSQAIEDMHKYGLGFQGFDV